jgi:hypothetical protein
MMSIPQIDAYRFGRIVVDGAAYRKDVIILPNDVLPEWWREQGHVLRVGDLQPVLDAKTEVLVVGQGVYARLRVPEQTRKALEAAGVDLIALRTKEACQTYNELRERRSVAAALHLSC